MSLHNDARNLDFSFINTELRVLPPPSHSSPNPSGFDQA